MSAPELAQLELLAQVDELITRLSRWSQAESPWGPINYCQALIRRLLKRVETLRIRLEAPLVVATFGGTGTGKSTLVNALVGQECTRTGRQRPTTTRPILIVHSQTELEALGLPLEDFEIVRCDSPILRDIVIVDCPDPDTSETETAGSNLQLLHQLLPHCDVLVYTSTQQKYRSARVSEELGLAATGCRLLFVQTHADLDSDVREDWRRQLDEHYEVPDVFFVDSLRALTEQQAGHRPSGDFARLQDLLTTRLAASQRLQIRRANLIDLLHAAIEHCRTHLSTHWEPVKQLEVALEQQRQELIESMARQLRDELLVSRNLWERRLLSSVTQIWGFSPFSSVLRVYNGLGSLIASMTFFRARTSAQMALIGAIHGTRWLTQRQQEKDAEERWQRIGSFGLDDAALREAQLVVSGYVHAAGLDAALAESHSLDRLRHQAVRVEDQFLGDAGRRSDDIINRLAVKKSGFFVRTFYEILFLLFVGFVLFRIGRNFFYDSMFLGEPLLTVDFYLSAGVFFVLWSGVLVMAFTRRLQRGLKREIDRLAQELALGRLSQGLFPELEHCCREIRLQRERLDALALSTADIRNHIATAPGLGTQIKPRGEPVLATERS